MKRWKKVAGSRGWALSSSFSFGPRIAQPQQLSGTAKTSRDATQRGHGDLSLNRWSRRRMVLPGGKVEIGNSP